MIGKIYSTQKTVVLYLKYWSKRSVSQKPS
jgi:hypothetical protein